MRPRFLAQTDIPDSLWALNASSKPPPANTGTSCREAPFPKVIGQGRGTTVVTHVELFELNSMIVAGGYSNEVGLPSSFESFKYPWVASFSIDTATGVVALAKGWKIDGLKEY
jgi:hypothetical protein